VSEVEVLEVAVDHREAVKLSPCVLVLSDERVGREVRELEDEIDGVVVTLCDKLVSDEALGELVSL